MPVALAASLLPACWTVAGAGPTPTYAVDAKVAVAESADRPGAELSRNEAQALVQKRYGARVVRVSTTDEDGRRVYVFRLLSAGGKVWTVRVDARSGVELP